MSLMHQVLNWFRGMHCCNTMDAAGHASADHTPSADGTRVMWPPWFGLKESNRIKLEVEHERMCNQNRSASIKYAIFVLHAEHGAKESAVETCRSSSCGSSLQSACDSVGSSCACCMLHGQKFNHHPCRQQQPEEKQLQRWVEPLLSGDLSNHATRYPLIISQNSHWLPVSLLLSSCELALQRALSRGWFFSWFSMISGRWCVRRLGILFI